MIMKKPLKLLAVPLTLASLSLSSCGDSGEISLENYVVSLDVFSEEGEVRIVQLADLHFTSGTDLEREEKRLKALIEYSKADLVVLTGDNTLNCSASTIDRLYEILEGCSTSDHPVYYAITWGNHDTQGFYSPTYPREKALSHAPYNGGHCLYTEVDDDIYGYSNYLINLDYLGDTVYQIYFLDSNILKQTSLLSYSYDVIREEQIGWYEKMVIASNPNVDLTSYLAQCKALLEEDPDAILPSLQGEVIPSLSYFHVPLWQTEYAYRLYKGEEARGTLFEGVGENTEKSWTIDGLGETKVYAGYYDSGYFSSAEILHSCKAMFYGHDHINDFSGIYAQNRTDEGIALCYGVKTTDELTYPEGKLGVNIAMINLEGELSLSRGYLPYADEYTQDLYSEGSMFGGYYL